MGTFFKGSSVGVSDPEDARLADQLATAQALRAKGLEGNTGAGYHGGKVFVVGNPWGNIASSIGGALLEHNARRGQQELLDRRNQQYEDYMRQIPSATEEQTYNPVENPGTGPLINGPVLKSARQQQQEMNRFALDAPNIPQFQALRQAGMLQALSAPEKQAAAEEAAANRKAMLEATLADRAAGREEKAAAEKELERLRQEGRKEIRMLAASLRPAPAPHNAQTVVSDQGILERQPDGTWKPIIVGDKTAMKPSAGGGKGVSAQTEKAINATDSLLSTVNMGLGLVDKSTSGIGEAVPGAIRQMYTTPTTKIADSTIGQLSAEKAHELYGAAFTAAEMDRANTFLPAKFDTAETKKWKLGQMKILLEKKAARMKGQPDPYPDMLTDILDPLSKGEMPVARSDRPALPKSIESPEDAAARAWLAANPNDPRATAIRKKLEGK